ncbi:hypothetical protein [Acidovorax sp. SUPP2825]|uniref:hypothetical protein n=1 Tax=Acidovorax sp. SUPP2825 TaxID=2920879 RepID=UPI0023DE20A9|nr:hypothetical protein [Acidovorax sp. SUPP2825]GKS96996.1 hypothetical protein AVAK2825_20695 [Acidovorax sp. SUPP2825]
MSTTDRDLPVRMRERADAEQLPADHDLRQRADALDLAVVGHFASPPTVSVAQLVGAWARARTAWCAHTGEALL